MGGFGTLGGHDKYLTTDNEFDIDALIDMDDLENSAVMNSSRIALNLLDTVVHSVDERMASLRKMKRCDEEYNQLFLSGEGGGNATSKCISVLY